MCLIVGLIHGSIIAGGRGLCGMSRQIIQCLNIGIIISYQNTVGTYTVHIREQVLFASLFIIRNVIHAHLIISGINSGEYGCEFCRLELQLILRQSGEYLLDHRDIITVQIAVVSLENKGAGTGSRGGYDNFGLLRIV